MMTLLIFAGVAVLWMAMNSRRRFREMEHRERLAMIDRGLLPPPEIDPGRFERQAGLRQPEPQGAARSRSIGVVMIGLGLAFMVLITFAAEAPGVGVGIGGAFAILGAAFLFNSVLMTRQDPYAPHQPIEPIRRSPAEPPPPPQHPTP
jgi:hypothetical protein